MWLSLYLILPYTLPLRIIQMFSRDLKLTILSNHAEHLKELVLFVIRTTSFYNSKIFTPNWSAGLLRKMTLVWERSCSTWNSWASKASTNWFNDRDHKDPLELNKPRSFETFIKPKTLAESSQALPPSKTPDVAWYIQKDMDHFYQTFFQASKSRSRNKLKAKTSDVYCSRSHIKCYNFCQQCEDHFAIYETTKPNQIYL